MYNLSDTLTKFSVRSDLFWEVEEWFKNLTREIL